jgi:hypothetical protein
MCLKNLATAVVYYTAELNKKIIIKITAVVYYTAELDVEQFIIPNFDYFATAVVYYTTELNKKIIIKITAVVYYTAELDTDFGADFDLQMERLLQFVTVGNGVKDGSVGDLKRKSSPKPSDDPKLLLR